MSTLKKLYDKVNREIVPKDITYIELERLLIKLGFIYNQGKGDHVIFIHAKYENIRIIIDSNGKRALKAIYIVKVREILEKLLEMGGFDEDEL